MKILSVFLLLISPLLATLFDFKETRYYSALDFQRVSYGTIKVEKEETVIEYKRPITQSIIIKQDSAFIVKNGDKTSVTNSETLLFLKVFEKLIRDENIDRFFKEEGGRFLPKSSLLGNYISYIKNDTDTIEIFLKNGDRILFERD